MQSPNFISPVLGMAAAVTWGMGDFSGGLAARRANVFGVVGVAYAAGVLLMVAGALLTGEHFPAAASLELEWALAAGCVGGVALSAFYAGLAIGEMGIVAPIAAVLTAALPVLFGAWAEGMPKKIQLAGFVLALLSIWLIAKTEGSAARPKGLGLALLSGVGFGAYLILIRKAGATAVFWPLAVARGTSAAVVAVLGLGFGGLQLPKAKSLNLSLAAGVLDASGVALFLIAARHGRLDVTAVLSSLYPAVTVILAHFVLKEELKPHQRAGMLAALVSVALIAA